MQHGAFAVGSLVRARGREWIVISNGGDLIQVKPITGLDSQTTGLYLPIEGHHIGTAEFEPPNPKLIGDPAGSLALFEASRLLLRNSAAPFRSAGHLSFVPRPYQFVPLIMALRQSPIRLLIADDVGVGKTIEAGMIARELLDRGIARRLLILCPAHLCDQWETELRDKFGISCAVVQPANFVRLERELPRRDLSVYQHYPMMVASIDFVKSARHRPLLLQYCPDLVIVDEAHLATRPRGATAGEYIQQQRYELLREIADRSDTNLVLVTATPHSGIEEHFRSLLGLLDSSFDLDPQRPEAAPSRSKLLPFIVQRRRRDVEEWLGQGTLFPQRGSVEQPYHLSDAYRKLFDDVLDYCRESTQPDRFKAPQQRVRHWAAVSLLRCVLSSPGAAVAVLSNREQRIQEKEHKAREPQIAELSAESEDAYGQQTLDGLAQDSVVDCAPTAALDDATALLTASELRKLADFQRRASAISGTTSDQVFVANQ
ncbi:MAG: DEAD/DEAH box helicase [Deltaproteobacteria bacterium]|nr:DEAD/DEAH box helicase [Deltaproteobacteria bacterium]